jgi:hypothetical protein
MIIGKEKGKEGTPHLQGACVIGNQVSFSTIKKYPGFTRAHIERMNGRPSDSLVYCSKEDGNPFIKGSLPKPGKRNDIDNILDRMKSGETISQIVEDPKDVALSAIVRYSRGFQYISTLLTKPRSSPPVVIWLHGPTGIGKTRSAVELSQILSPARPPWLSAGSLRWYDGYSGHPVAIFDDLRTKHTSFHMLLRLLDRYPMRVEIKGASVHWIPDYIIVTAPKSPSEMWNLRTAEDINQLERRVTHNVDCSLFGNYDELLHKLLTILGINKEPEATSQSPLPRTIIDLTADDSSLDGPLFDDSLEALLEEEEEEKEKAEEKTSSSFDAADHLAGLFSHAGVAFCGQSEIINID